MFKLSKQVDYALQFLSRLSTLQEGEVLSLRIFSKESTISFLFLQRIAGQLKRAGIVDAVHGTKGGYVLKQSYEDISLLDVMHAIEDTAIAPCMNEQKGCGKSTTCAIRHGVVHVQRQMLSILRDTPIASLSV